MLEYTQELYRFLNGFDSSFSSKVLPLNYVNKGQSVVHVTQKAKTFANIPKSKGKKIEWKSKYAFSDWKCTLPYVYKNIHSLQRNLEILKPYADDILLHGSIASNDAIADWSDVDITILLKDQITQNAGALVELRKKIIKILPLLLRIDPLQHHGFFIIHKHHTETSMPFKVLENSISLFDTLLPHTMYLLNDQSKAFEDALEFFALRQKHPPRNLYQWKTYMNTIFILPAWYYNKKGKYYDKKEAIDRFLTQFPALGEDFLYLSRYRHEWNYFFIPPPVCTYHQQVWLNKYFLQLKKPLNKSGIVIAANRIVQGIPK